MTDNDEQWFSLRNVRYHREGEHAIDNVHLLFPLATGIFEYALPTDCSDKILRLVGYLFSSLDEDESFDSDNFLKLLDKLDGVDGTSMDSLIKDEFLAADFLVYSSFKAHGAIDVSLGKIPEVNFGLRASMIILQRVLSSFQSVAILIKNSMFFDVNCLLRSILEQIGHAYQIRIAMAREELDAFKSTMGIRALKEIIPDAGSLNGVLSDYIHNNNLWGHYIESEGGQDGADSKTYVVTRSGVRTKDCIVYFVRVIEAYMAVLAGIYIDNCQQVESNFKEIVADCFHQIAKLKKDMAEKYYSDVGRTL